MGHDHAGTAGLTLPARAPAHDRFAHWPRWLARVALALLALMLVLAAWAPAYPPPPPDPPKVIVTDAAGKVTAERDDNDLHLYRTIIGRVAQGENYYKVATEEQRENNYPVAPALTVRPPTLALAFAAIGDTGMVVLQIALFAAMIVANARRMMVEPGAARYRLLALTLLMVGIAGGLNRQVNVLHEIWAALLIGLAVGLHRPAEGKWTAAWVAAALALMVRELALPFVLLMAAYALWHRRWREAAGWAALIVLFGIGMVVHFQLASEWVRPGDPESPSWLVMSGISGLLYKVNNSTFLALLPVWASGPLVVLALFGWTGWRAPMGTFTALLTLGYGAAFMIAGRDNNFYWGVILTPLLFMGAAFLPLSLPSLWRRAMGGTKADAPAVPEVLGQHA